jgi:hypothetical protein
MKKSSFIVFAAASLMALASCSKDTEIFNAENAKEAAIKANLEKVFGFTFDPNHDWKTTTSGELTINVDASVKKVHLLVKVQDVDEEVPSYVTTFSIRQLNEAEVNGQTSIKMSYDAPKDNLGLYVCFVTDKGNFFQDVEGNAITFNNAAQARTTRALSTGYILPSDEFKIASSKESYASERGWNSGEQLYELSAADYKKLKMSSPDYSDKFKEDFRNQILGNLPNGKNKDNLPYVLSIQAYDKLVYPLTTGEEPIIVTPAYKCDNPTKWGYEVYRSELYYYYFPADAVNLDDDDATAEYVKKLPKYKALPFSEAFTDEKEDDQFAKHGSFALLYFGDEAPTEGTVGTFEFPKNYKIGFMIRANTDFEKETIDNQVYYVKQGEVYADGRLNKEINTLSPWHFKSSKLSQDGRPGTRAVWMNVNGKMMMTWESGTDRDFNDVILDIEGGVIPNDPKFIPITYTYCFEDTEEGDYDMNDVVIRAVRKNKTTIEYSILACGAYNELYIKNLQYDSWTSDSDPKINETEVHKLFGTTPGHFVNTDGSNFDPIVVTRTVDEDFNLTDETTNHRPYIHNATTNKDIYLSEEGEDPHGIMIVYDFNFPKEKVCIKDAYKQFEEWGKNRNNNKWWYMYAILENVITKFRQ